MGLLLDNHLVGLEVVLMVSLWLIGFQILSSHCGTYEKSLEIVSIYFQVNLRREEEGTPFPPLSDEPAGCVR